MKSPRRKLAILFLVPSSDRQTAPVIHYYASIFYLFIHLKLKSESSHDAMRVSFLGSSWFLEQAYKSFPCQHVPSSILQTLYY